MKWIRNQTSCVANDMWQPITVQQWQVATNCNVPTDLASFTKLFTWPLSGCNQKSPNFLCLLKSPQIFMNAYFQFFVSHVQYVLNVNYFQRCLSHTVSPKCRLTKQDTSRFRSLKELSSSLARCCSGWISSTPWWIDWTQFHNIQSITSRAP